MSSMAICLWQWEKTSRKWKLAEAYGIDGDGYITTPSKLAESERGGRSYTKWVESANTGRCATHWGMESGVTLCAINPPGDTSWIRSFKEFVKIDWSEVLEDGLTLYFGTSKQARKLVFGDK